MTTLAFLQHILPTEGWYCGFIIEGERKYNHWCESISELCDFLSRKDFACSTVYHACGGYRERTRRTQENSLGARCFWLDVDAGEGKAYVDAHQAYQEVERFRRAVALPSPIWVGSGNGLHVYWPLVDCLAPSDWKKYAEGLKRLCRVHGLQADGARTADIASILRPPGTHHRKGTPKLVECGQLVGPYPIEQFRGLLDAAPERREVNGKHPSGTIAAALANFHTGNTPKAGDCADDCGQLAQFRSEQGRIPEPLWYACLGVCAFTDGGDEDAHQWSSGYDGYTFEETQERLDRAKTLTGATTCERFHSLNPEVCEVCPHFGQIKSPISLGRQLPPPAPIEIETPEIGLPKLPTGYAWRGNKLVCPSEEGAKGVDILLSGHPIFLSTVQTGEIRGDYTYCFRASSPSQGWMDILIAASLFFSPGGHGEMARQGANIHEWLMFSRYAKLAIDEQYEKARLNMRYEQFGWKENETEFLYGLDLYTAEGKRKVQGSEELQVRTNAKSQWIGPVKGGSLDGWTRAANSLFAAGCEAQSLALLASFAAALMRFQSRDEGGAILSLVTRKSGTGKSAALAGAASVWGKREGLGLTNADSKISKFLTLGSLGNLPVVYDEIEARDPRVIRDFVVNFTNGKDKMRATRGGTIAHTASTWQTVLISASNSSLVDALSTENSVEAPAMRILEMPVNIPEHLKHSIGDKLQKDLMDNRGYAGDAFISWLIQPENLAWTKAALETWTAEIWRTTKLKQEYRFWVRLTGAVAVAGAIVSKLGLVEFSTERIIKWLMQQIGKGLEDVATENDEWVVDTLNDFLRAHGENTIVMQGPYVSGMRTTRPVIENKRELIVRYEMRPARFYIAKTPVRQWLAGKDISYREWVRLLIKLRVCVNQAKLVSLATGTDHPSVRVPCIEINGAHPLMTGIVGTQTDNVVHMDQVTV